MPVTPFSNASPFNDQLRKRELHGQLRFDSASQSWEAFGGSGWHVSESHPKGLRIEFSEPLVEDYNLVVSWLRGCSREDTVTKKEGFQIATQGGDVTISFSVIGFTAEVTPDDRAIPTSQLIEDARGIFNLFRNDAEHGVVTVMASASLNSAAVTGQNLTAAKEKLDKLRTTTPLPVKDIQVQEQKVLRLERLLKNAHYYDSALEFGKSWGAYLIKEQAKSLGGRYIPLCTGGGPGIMQAIAEGSNQIPLDGGKTGRANLVAIDTIFVPESKFDVSKEPATLSSVRLRCNDFSLREMALINFSHVILFWPGGVGTAWELFETLSKLQTKHLRRRRVKAIMVHDDFWGPFVKGIEHFREQGTVNSIDDLILLPDNPDAQNLSHQEILERYLVELVPDAQTAFAKARAHLEFLADRNELSILG